MNKIDNLCIIRTLVILNTIILNKREKLITPKENAKVLLHSCCAPCSGEVIQAMVESGINLTIFFYNPNIHPKKEYEIRKDENVKYAKKFVT